MPQLAKCRELVGASPRRLYLGAGSQRLPSPRRPKAHMTGRKTPPVLTGARYRRTQGGSLLLAMRYKRKIKRLAGGDNRIEKERKELQGELKGIQDQRRQNEEEQKRALQYEEDRNYQNEQDIKNIDRQLERWQNEPQLFGLLSDQWKAMKKLQSVRNGFI